MPTKCCYPDCGGIFPDTLLEPCLKENCNIRLHHVCQTEWESTRDVDIGLHKYCYNCCIEAVKTKYPHGLVSNEKEKSGNKKNDNDDDSDRTIDLNSTAVQDTSNDKMAEEAEETVEAQAIEIQERPQTGKNLPEIIIPANEEQIKPALKCQKGLKGNSVVVCPSIFLHNNETLLDSIIGEFTDMYGPYAYGKVIQVPNKKRM